MTGRRPAARRFAGVDTRWLMLIAALGAFALLVGIPLLLALIGYLNLQDSPLILRGVSAAGVDLSQKPVERAEIELHQKWNLEQRIYLEDGISSALVSPKDLGLQLDVIAIATQAHQVGRSGNLVQRIEEILTARFEGIDILPVIIFNEADARMGLEAIAPSFSAPAQEAALRYENGALVAIPGEFGYTINIDDTLALLRQKPLVVLFRGQLALSLRPVLPRITDLSPLLLQAQQMLAAPRSLIFNDPITNETFQREIPPEVLASWLSADTSGEVPRLAVASDSVLLYLQQESRAFQPERFFTPEDWVEPLTAIFDDAPLPSIPLKHNPTSYTVQSGDTLLKIGWKSGMPYWRIANANPEVNPDQLFAGQVLVIPSKDDLLPLPVVTNKRIVISISKQRLWAYENGQEVAKHVISTGIDRSPTQPGVFQVQTHVKNAYASIWDLTMPDFLGIYEAWPGFMNGIHGLPLLSNGKRLWANILGKPASYGCIILDLDASAWLYRWAEEGVIVEIRP